MSLVTYPTCRVFFYTITLFFPPVFSAALLTEKYNKTLLPPDKKLYLVHAAQACTPIGLHIMLQWVMKRHITWPSFLRFDVHGKGCSSVLCPSVGHSLIYKVRLRALLLSWLQNTFPWLVICGSVLLLLFVLFCSAFYRFHLRPRISLTVGWMKIFLPLEYASWAEQQVINVAGWQQCKREFPWQRLTSNQTGLEKTNDRTRSMRTGSEVNENGWAYSFRLNKNLNNEREKRDLHEPTRHSCGTVNYKSCFLNGPHRRESAIWTSSVGRTVHQTWLASIVLAL